MITERTQVSSVVSSTEQQASRGRSLNRRAPIVWDTGAGGVGNFVGPLKELMALFKGTTSTSPQRTPANVAAAAVHSLKLFILMSIFIKFLTSTQLAAKIEHAC